MQLFFTSLILLMNIHHALPGCKEDSKNFEQTDRWLIEKGYVTFSSLYETTFKDVHFHGEVLQSKSGARVLLFYGKTYADSRIGNYLAQTKAMLKLESQPEHSVRDVCFWAPDTLLTLKELHPTDIVLAKESWGKLSPPQFMRILVGLARHVAFLVRHELRFRYLNWFPIVVLPQGDPDRPYIASYNGLYTITESVCRKHNGEEFASHDEFVQQFPTHNYLDLIHEAISHIVFPRDERSVKAVRDFTVEILKVLRDAERSAETLEQLIVKLQAVETLAARVQYPGVNEAQIAAAAAPMIKPPSSLQRRGAIRRSKSRSVSPPQDQGAHRTHPSHAGQPSLSSHSHQPSVTHKKK